MSGDLPGPEHWFWNVPIFFPPREESTEAAASPDAALDLSDPVSLDAAEKGNDNVKGPIQAAAIYARPQGERQSGKI